MNFDNTFLSLPGIEVIRVSDVTQDPISGFWLRTISFWNGPIANTALPVLQVTVQCIAKNSCELTTPPLTF